MRTVQWMYEVCRWLVALGRGLFRPKVVFEFEEGGQYLFVLLVWGSHLLSVCWIVCHSALFLTLAKIVVYPRA